MIKNINFNDKNVKIMIVIFIVVLAVVIIFSGINIAKHNSSLESKEVFATDVMFSDDLIENSGIKDIGFTLKNGQSNCVEGICISEVTTSCYEGRGVIYFHVINNTGNPTSGFLKIILGNEEYSTVVYYTFETGSTSSNIDSSNISDKSKSSDEKVYNVDTNTDYYGYATYEDFDLRNIGKLFRVESLNEDDLEYGLTYFYTNPVEGYYKKRPNSSSSEEYPSE